MQNKREFIGNENVICEYFLEPYSNRKSFYRKATVYMTEKYYYLKSYYTLMCRYNKETHKIERLDDYRSMTTTCHLSSFYCEMGIGSEWNTKKFYKLPLTSICEEEEISEDFVEQFKEDYDNLHPEIKERLANSDVMVTSKKEAEDIMRISKMFSIMMGMAKGKE